MRILISGCSFTSCIDYPNWPAYINKDHQITNLAWPAAGNQYIANSVISALEQQDYDHVLVMWSGLTRLDFPTDISNKGWKNILDDYNFRKELPGTNLAYVFSGGCRGSWQSADSLIRKTFHTQYRVSSDVSLGYQSLLEIIKLESYLKHRGINYCFMSYINYWNSQEHCANGNFGIYQHPELARLANQVDFDQWIFTDENKNGLFEFCQSTNDFIDTGQYPQHWKFSENTPGTHPGLLASEQWAKIVSGRLGL